MSVIELRGIKREYRMESKGNAKVPDTKYILLSKFGIIPRIEQFETGDVFEIINVTSNQDVIFG